MDFYRGFGTCSNNAFSLTEEEIEAMGGVELEGEGWDKGLCPDCGAPVRPVRAEEIAEMRKQHLLKIGNPKK
ncbi:MAG: hypothetical protein U9R10_01640 [Euryarchaeota archaeon]|nr:hypothetical protein [Euryarchaeota archaeon]